MPFDPTNLFPPIRELFRPDPGYILVDVDLDRADAQIVAWEANEPELKAIFQQGLDIHTDNAAWIYQTPTSGVTKPQRQASKSVIHALHYGGKARTLASTAGVTVSRMEAFTAYWWGRFPGIPRWHSRVKSKLQLSRQIHNVWGFRRFYFDRLDGVLPQALAWLGQSSVAITINKAMRRLYDEVPEVQLLAQVHDSLLLQVPEEAAPAIFYTILDKMQIVVPYPDPLIIPVSLKWSRDSWGKMQSWKPGEELMEKTKAA